MMRMAFMRHRPAAFITFCASAIAGTTTSHASLGVVSHNATGPAYAVTYADGYCYAGFGGRFHILTPELEIVSHFDLPSVIDGISTNGTTAYVATWFGGISVLNLVAPGGPQLLGTLSLPGQGRGIFVENGLAYVASSEAGIRVVDVSSASSPTELGFYDTSGSAFSIVIDGTNGYVADRTGGVVILNVAAPSTPQLVSTYSAGPSQRAYDVDKQGSNLFVAYGNAGLRVVDISNMSSPVGIGSLSVSGEVFSISIDNNLAYLTILGGGLAVVDVSIPSSPTLVGAIVTDGSSYEGAVEGQRIFLADGDEALRLIDVETPSAPTEISLVNAAGLAADVVATGDNIVVANFAQSTNGFRVLDVVNPLLVEEVGRLATTGPTPRVATDGPYVYLTEQSPNYGLTIAGIQNPGSPALVSHLSFGGPPTRIDVLGGKAYLTRDQTLSIVNVQNPAAPTLLGTFVAGSAFDAFLSGVTVAGTKAYLTDYLLGLRIVNVENPASPVQLGTYASPSTAYDVAVAGGIAYLATSDGLRLIDVSTASSPSLVSTLPLPFESYSVLLNASTAYLCAGPAGVIAIDVSSPASPVISGQYDTGDRAIAACLYYNNIVVADGSNGVYVLADDAIVSTSPTSTTATGIHAYPNPFNPATTISFSLSRSDKLMLKVFDVRGSLVRTLVNGSHLAGVHEVKWDGKDSRGRQVSSGVYFCQLRGTLSSSTVKLVLTK